MFVLTLLHLFLDPISSVILLYSVHEELLFANTNHTGFLHLKPFYSKSRIQKAVSSSTPSAVSACHVTHALPIIMVPGDFISSQAVLTSCLILFIFFARLIAFLCLIFPSRLSVQHSHGGHRASRGLGNRESYKGKLL